MKEEELTLETMVNMIPAVKRILPQKDFIDYLRVILHTFEEVMFGDVGPTENVKARSKKFNTFLEENFDEAWRIEFVNGLI